MVQEQKIDIDRIAAKVFEQWLEIKMISQNCWHTIRVDEKGNVRRGVDTSQTSTNWNGRTPTCVDILQFHETGSWDDILGDEYACKEGKDGRKLHYLNDSRVSLAEAKDAASEMYSDEFFESDMDANVKKELFEFFFDYLMPPENIIGRPVGDITRELPMSVSDGLDLLNAKGYYARTSDGIMTRNFDEAIAG